MNNDMKQYLTKKNKFCFAAAGLGQNLIIGATSYLLFFFTNIALIGYAAASVIMIISKIFDAFNDPIMGVVVDKTRTKLGKLRPYLLFAPIPLGILTIMIFYVPDFSRNGKIAYAAITYLLWGIVYTIGDIPFWGSATAMTPNPEERVKFITFSRIFHCIGGALPMVLLPAMEFVYGKDTSASYLALGIIAGVLGGSLFMLSFFGTDERNTSKDKAPTIKECFRYLFKNKPLFIVVLSNILGFGRPILNIAGMYVATYLFFDLPSFMSPAMANTFMMVGFAVSGFLTMIFTPQITKKFNYKQIVFFCCAFAIIGNILLLILGHLIGYSVYLFLIMQLILGTSYGLMCNVNYAMISESVDYLEWKEGIRAEGVSISMQTLMNKLMNALQTAILPILLMIVGFIEPTKANPLPAQTASAKHGLFLIICILPIISWALCALLFRNYDFIGEKREKIYKELNDRKTINSTN